jgi:hypothetical protein
MAHASGVAVLHSIDAKLHGGSQNLNPRGGSVRRNFQSLEMSEGGFFQWLEPGDSDAGHNW